MSVMTPWRHDWFSVPSQFNEDGLHSVLPLPLGETGQLARIDDTVGWVDAGQVDLADELDRGGGQGTRGRSAS